MKSKYPPLEVVVDRRRWLRGQGSIFSSLFDDGNKKMCCLGFASRACGCTIDEIRDRSTPSCVVIATGDSVRKKLARFINKNDNSASTRRMMEINDDITITDAERESRLQKWGKKLNIQFTFVN